jgi:DNA recombination protein RmuC
VDLEAAQALGLLVAGLDSVDAGPPRADRAEVGDPFDPVGWALEHDLDRSVGAISRPARDARGPRPLTGRVAEEHALDAAGHDQSPADHVVPIGHRGTNYRLVQGFPSAARATISGPMNVAWLILGLFLGAAGVALALRPRLRAGLAEARRASELDRDLVRARADLEHERARAEERLATVNEAQERLSASFKALSSDALQASVSQLAEFARTQLHAAQAQSAGELEKRQQAVEQLVAPLKEQLGRVDGQLMRLDQERRESRGRLEAQLRTLTETGQRLRDETGALVTALRKPNARGQWGQMQLRNVVELAGMLKHCDFIEQTSLADGETTLRPDLVVNLPGGKQVVVDAKAPLQGVLDAYEASDEATREQFLRDHARLLRKHVKSLSDKTYWAGLDTAPDFVVMFLPGEHLYSAALEADPNLIEDAMARRVLIATPTTLLAILWAVSYGWQQERVAHSAQEVAELGRELHGRLVKLSNHLSTLGSRLNSTVRAYNDTVGSYEARVLPGARRFADHGAVADGREFPDLEHVTTSARNVNAAELTLELGLPDDPSPAEVAPRRLRAAD